MSDLTISADIISGIKDAMNDLGSTLKLRVMTYETMDVNNPGADLSQSYTDTDFEGLVFDFDEKYMPGSTVLDGDKMVLVSVDGMSVDTIKSIQPGNYIIDDSENYSIIKTAPIRVAGVTVVVIAQVKG